MKLKVKMPPLHPRQDEIRKHPARFKVMSCGRRFGKTKLCAALGLETALKGGVCWWVAPTYDVSKIGWRMIENLVKQIPGHRFLQADREMTLPTGGRIVMRSADASKSLLGEGIDRLILEEAARIPSEIWYRALRPALSDTLGDALFPSTPDGRNWFYTLFKKGLEGLPDWQSWQCTSYENPFVPNSEIEAARKDLPEWAFEQEYLAKFITFAGKVYKSFDPAGECVFRESNRSYEEHWGGIDPGFRNPTCMGVAGEYDGGLDLREEIYETGLTNPQIIANAKMLQEKYNPRHWWCDPSDPGLIRELREAGLPVSPAPRMKGHLEESWVKNGIVEVEKLLIKNALRFDAAKCPNVIREVDTYRYPQLREGSPEKERPLKVDDHGPDMLRYLVVGWQQIKSISFEVAYV